MFICLLLWQSANSFTCFWYIKQINVKRGSWSINPIWRYVMHRYLRKRFLDDSKLTFHKIFRTRSICTCSCMLVRTLPAFADPVLWSFTCLNTNENQFVSSCVILSISFTIKLWITTLVYVVVPTLNCRAMEGMHLKIGFDQNIANVIKTLLGCTQTPKLLRYPY